MDTTAAFNQVKLIQNGFKLISLLQLTAYLWPQQAVVHDGDSFDFIIVGAGTAGCVIANRLTENPNINFLLIEAGGDPPLESDLPFPFLFLKRSGYDWNYTSEDDYISEQCHRKPYFEMSLGKMLGGSSSLHFFVHNRGYPVDYDSWAKVTNDPSWGWERVLKYFIKSEKIKIPEVLNSSDRKFHGTDGFMSVTRENSVDLSIFLNSFKEIGNAVVDDFNPDHPLGFSSFTVLIGEGHRQSSAYSYLTPIKNRPNLHVLKNTQVTKIMFMDKKATGVEAVTSDGNIISIKTNKEIIITAGAFNSPKLLMLSGIGPKAHLKSLDIEVVADLPVGENLQDHVGVLVLYNLKNFEKPPLIDPHFFPAPTFKGNVALSKNQDYPDYEVVNFVTDKDLMLTFCSFIYRFNEEICNSIYKHSKGEMSVLNQIVNLAPKSRGKVLLRSADPTDSPIIFTGHFAEDVDLKNLMKYIMNLNPVLNTTFYKQVGAELVHPTTTKCKQYEAESEEYWHCYAQCVSSSMSHFTSTCAMGTVLDEKLRVKGIDSLRVADASIMPIIPRGNPAAIVVMIGEKASDIIKADNSL